MSQEAVITAVEQTDIVAPQIQPDGTAIVLQRHALYQRDRGADNAGSIFEDAAQEARERDDTFMKDVLDQEVDGAETMFLFISSPTQYAKKGHRSMETAQLAQDAAVAELTARGIDPSSRIINFNDAFNTKGFDKTGQSIRPDKKLVEPDIFDTPDYVDFLRDKYGKEDGPGKGISKRAWAVHEADGEKEAREKFGAEGVYDVIDRTRQSIKVMERYSRQFHHENPNKRLVIWAASHYDTISPLVKTETGQALEGFVSVDYAAGVVMNIQPGSHEVTMRAQDQEVAMNLGRVANT